MYLSMKIKGTELKGVLEILSGLGSIIGIVTGYGLDGLGIESRWGVSFSAPIQTCPGAHPASCTMGPGSFPGVKSGWGATLTPHPLLVPWSWKSRAIPLLPLWVVRPVQSLSACTRVTFTFTWNIKVSEMKEVTEIVFMHPLLKVRLSRKMMNTCTIQKHIFIVFTLWH